MAGGKSGVSLNWGGLDKAIGNAGKRLGNRKALMASVGEALVSGTLARFEAGEAPDGTKWEPSGRAWEDGLAKEGRKATEKRKAVKGRAKDGRFGKTLIDTALLMKSIDYAATDALVMVGSNLAYARIHQLGGQAGRGHAVTLPARPYLGVSAADMQEVKALLRDFVAAGFKGK